jgi:PPM family protein phosphatase
MEDTGEFGLNAPFSFEEPVSASACVQLDIGVSTHRGNVRPQNEDAYIIYQMGRYWEHLKSSLQAGEIPERYDEKTYVMAVADGIGGRKGGQVASNLALRIIVNLVLKTGKYAAKLDNPETREEEIAAAMKRAQAFFDRADQELVRYGDSYPALKGMGTTLTAAYVFGKDLFTMHVGDSRVYLFRNATLYRLTKDQTFAQQLVDRGAFTQELAEKHYFRHKLTSCLGGEGGKVDMEIQHYEMYDRDVLLLCTDGLTDMVAEPKIASVLQKNLPAQSSCDELLQNALQAGGEDNITVIVCAYSLAQP